VNETFEKTMLAPVVEEVVVEGEEAEVVVEEEEGREDEGGRGLTDMAGVRSRRAKTCGRKGGREGGREGGKEICEATV
jgi:hypothetical protein